MSSIPKKRPKPNAKPPPSSSSTSSMSSLMEPPQSFFPSTNEFLRLVAVLAIATFVALGCNLLATTFNRQPKPFCDSGDLDSHDAISDFCEPCPSNGECYQGKLECMRGYTQHGKFCVEDGDINETAKKLSEWVEIHLCEAYAQFLCDGIGTVWVCHLGQPLNLIRIGSILLCYYRPVNAMCLSSVDNICSSNYIPHFQVREDDVWKELDGHELMKNVGLDSATYMYAKQRAMDAVGRLLETRTNPRGIKELKCPDLLVERYKPFPCRIRQWLIEHALIIFPVCVLFLGCTILLLKVRRRQYLSSRAEELYHQVCEILEENALTSNSINGEREPWVVASRLRDHLILPRERKDPVLWKKVEELVQEDSRVDRYPKLVKGESKVVWEWQVEGSLSSSRLRKKVEASKLKSAEGMGINSDQQRNALEAEPKALTF
ncbi:uncharacterized protein LOC132176548 isoform X2 [Corylus avellana]|uniref:uncharacterized protein LOC132176548 isoform X2 n=1 Tax=Corylus avellana TaxID=13451 RepID=UPI00286C1B4D|nr:uncharacterized protein LOC132176548 isoform X2 [Corylus avellana]